MEVAAEEVAAEDVFVVPICCAMGFAHVLLLTGCDQHLVHLLIRPLRRVRVLLIPGAVLVGFLVNLPVISQTSTAVAVGTLLVPLMLAARVSPLTTGAACLLGCSLGGELLNPGAPELRTVSNALGVDPAVCVSRIFPLLMVQLGVATVIFCLRHGGGEGDLQRGRPCARRVVAKTTPSRVDRRCAVMIDADNE
jgi:DcuC family C4-dicarboxylate transporter